MLLGASRLAEIQKMAMVVVKNRRRSCSKNTQDMWLCIYTFIESGYLFILIQLLILILHLTTLIPLLGIRRIQH